MFMTGMAENEQAAKKIINRITEMMKLLKAYYESETGINLQDTHGLPRQLIVMHVKCALEVKAAGMCGYSNYVAVEVLLKSILDTDDMPLPDVYVELVEEEDMPLQVEGNRTDAKSHIATQSPYYGSKCK